MRAVLTIEMDGAAFADRPADELARVIRLAASHTFSVVPHKCGVPGGCGEPSGPVILRDINGNRVGELRIEDEPTVPPHRLPTRAADGFGEPGAPDVCIDCYSTRPEPHAKDCSRRPRS